MHEAASKGFSAEAGKYESGRPDYPEALQVWLADELGLRSGVRALDLGAGTGKFTKRLLRTGAAVSALEPVDAMRQRLTQACPEAQVLAGTAEAIPLQRAAQDVVVCAQAFHWFANAEALREIHRVLRPGGRLGLIWNVRDETLDWVAAITELLTPHEGDAPRFHTGRWRLPFADQAGFAAPRQTVFEHQHAGSFEEVVVDRFLSVSFIAALPATARLSFEAQLRKLPQRYPALRESRIAFPYRTEAWFAARLG